MTISNETRNRRVRVWTERKSVWEDKLASAKSQNDTDVAKLMISEAEDALKRLGVKDTTKQDKTKSTEGSSTNIPKRKIAKTDTTTHKDKDSTDTTGTLGL